MSPRWYCEAAYLELIEFVGLTYEKLRVAFRLPDIGAKARFIQQHNLGVGDVIDGQIVDDLFRDFAAAPTATQGLTEEWLQMVFGLRSTLIDTLAPDEPRPAALFIRQQVLASQWTRADASPTRPLGLLPIVDPFLIGDVDLVDRVVAPAHDNFKTWRPIDFLTRRRLEVMVLETAIAAGTSPQPANTWGARLKALLVDLGTSQTVVSGSQIPVLMFGFRAGPDLLDYPRLKTLRDALDLRQDVTAELARFQVSADDVKTMMRFIELVDGNQPVTADETWAFKGIFLAHAVRIGFWPLWLQQEQLNGQQGAGLSLAPRFFRARVTGSAADPEWIPQTRLVDREERLRWEETLSGRRRALEEMEADLAASRNRLEARLLPELRKALIGASNAGTYSAQQAVVLTDRYQIDFEAGGCHRTTRVTQAIQTIQGLLFGVRHGVLNDKNWSLPDLNFDEIWRWVRHVRHLARGDHRVPVPRESAAAFAPTRCQSRVSGRASTVARR